MNQDSTGSPNNPGDPDPTLDNDATIGSGKPTGSRKSSDIGEAIGPYRLIRRLGEGGMGEVFLAEQSEPIKRQVALKVIKPGMDTRLVVARFELERQTLALMNHPHIARVYDAGQTAQGRPYFVMEYIDGIPIKKYCDSRQLTTAQRLELIVEVCAGIQHAHQKAIIHRDLKPGNILVTEVDGKPVPKIIDFGISRATEQRQAEQTMFTQLGHTIGTPAYMSPEQTDPTNTDIDTRTDIYSLGVVLYELLVGLLPFDTDAVYSAGYDAIMKFVREQEPPRPSARFKGSGEQTAEIALRQNTEPEKLVRTLRGDLDWILLKALEKDRNRRYETANSLAMDIRRYLTNEPVLASPPSASYRTRKFVRRNRTGVTVAAASLVILFAFALTSSIQARLIAKERDRATFEASKSLAINSFLTNMLKSTNPWTSGENDLTVVEAMDAARSGVDSLFAGQPLLAAEMHATIGRTFLALQKMPKAEEELQKALDLRLSLLGPDDPALAESWKAMAELQGLNFDLDQAAAAAEEVIRIRRLTAGPEDPEVLSAYDILADILVTGDRFAEGDSVLNLIEAALDRSEGETRPARANVLRLRAIIAVSSREDFATADSLSREGLRLLRESLPDSPQIPVFLNNCAVNLMTLGEYDQAREYYEEALAIFGKSFGKDHPQYALTLENLGGIAYRTGDLKECMNMLEQVYEIRARNMGEDHPSAMRTQLNMATVANGMGDHDRAIEIYEQVIPIMVAVNGEIHIDTATCYRNLGIALRDAGRLDEADSKLQEARRVFQELYGPGHQQLARNDCDVAKLRMIQDRWSEADVLVQRAIPVLEKAYGNESPITRSAVDMLAEVDAHLGRPGSGG